MFIKRITSVLVCWLLFTCTASNAAQFPLTWRWSNPVPHGNNIIEMAYQTNLWIQVAERGQIYSSSDAATWTPRDSHTTNALRSVTFLGNRIIVTGENGTVVYGDSVADLKFISLGTSDWLEGVTASPTLAVAVGDNGAIYTSADGANWQRQNAPFTDWLRSVAFGNPGGSGLFVAVGEGGFIATSPNGSTWEKRAGNVTSPDLNKVVWNNGQFWIAGNSGQVLASDTGLTWQSVITGATNTLNAIASTANSRLVVGDSEVRLFEGRGPWSNELASTKSFPPPAWNYLSAVSDGSSFFIAGRTGIFVEGFKTNSTTSPTFWSSISESPRNWLWDIKRLNQVYIAVGDQATVMTSLDGISWDEEFVPDSAANSIFLGVGGKTNLAVAVGNGGTIITSPENFQSVVSTNSDGTHITNQVSTLGIIWNAVEPRPTSNDLQGVGTFNGLLVVTGGGGTILTSSSGTSWTRQTTPTTAFLSSVESFPGGLVAVGREGTILTSPDANTWTKRISGTTNWIYRVRYLGNRLIAVGQNGTVLTSGDGVSWTSQKSTTTRWLNDVQYIDATYFAVGTQGALLTSFNAVDWVDRGTITQKSLYGAATDNGQLVIVGLEGTILRSQIVPFNTPILLVDYPRAPTQNLFLFAGQRDQRFSLDRSTNLFNWSAGPQLEIFDPSGTLLYLDDRPNAHPFQFFRARPLP
jgi:hypothetical protein